MRFALLGDHPDGLDMARALVESGRHELTVYSGPPVGAEFLRRWDIRPRPVGDLEEVLADPTIEALIVAGSPAHRPAQLRRALQSERHVLCVHPADHSPDTAYEAAMLQADTRRLLFPLLPDALHPAIRRLAELAQADAPLRLIEIERCSAEALLLEHDIPGHKPGLPGWDVLRALGGEVGEVFGYAPEEELTPDQPLLLAGQFERGGLFQVTYVPHHPEPGLRIAVLGRFERIELLFPQGWPGPARLTRRDESGGQLEETWETWNPWPALVDEFEAALEAQRARRLGLREVSLEPALAGSAQPGLSEALTAAGRADALTDRPAPLPRIGPPERVLHWQDALRCLELDDAARRSVTKRRASTLEYQEATEEAGFKGTMTLVGCGLLWGSLVLLILSRWVPWLGWGILPIFGFFLLLQLLRWVVPEKPANTAASRGREPPDKRY
ncbi:MAG: hypothetical protein L0Z62_11345, partial [Gemmataceae bacterium]|nr:hypothetical protein [Gemmataceae bacterium]